MKRLVQVRGSREPGDVGVAQAGAAHALVHHLAHVLARHAGVQPQRGAAGLEAVEVVVEAEEPALPDMRHVVGGVRVQEAPVEDRDLRVLGRHVLPVDVGTSVHACMVAAMR
jgi:hypothetical protein